MSTADTITIADAAPLDLPGPRELRAYIEEATAEYNSSERRSRWALCLAVFVATSLAVGAFHGLVLWLTVAVLTALGSAFMRHDARQHAADADWACQWLQRLENLCAAPDGAPAGELLDLHRAAAADLARDIKLKRRGKLGGTGATPDPAPAD